MRGRPRVEGVEQAFLDDALRLGAHLLDLLRAHQLDRELRQVAHDRVDVATDVSHLGELRGLHLEEGRLREAGQAPGDLGLAHAGRPDHQDVFRVDLVAQLALDPLAAPAVAQRDCNRALGGILADDVPIQLRDDFARREGPHTLSSSTVISSLV
jgi:hypothetical protein